MALMKQFGLSIPLDDAARIARLERQLARERAARQEAERIAETGLRDLYATQQRLLLLQRIAQAANSLNDFHAALKMALQEVCEEMNWEFGNAYLVDQETRNCVAANLWSASSPDRFFSFIEASRTRCFAPGEGLPGRVAKSGKPLWIEDVRADGNFPRRRLARKCGIIAGCGFPVVVNQQTIAVIEFFSRKLLLESQELVSTFMQIGTQLASVYEREANRRTLMHEAHHDSLTGLPNWTFLKIKGDAAFERVDAGGGCLAALVVDLDDFKAMNDRHGHRFSDEVLIETSVRLKAVIKTWCEDHSDRLRPPKSTLARTDGDEFVVLIEGDLDPQAVGCLSQSIRDEISRSFSFENKVASISASVGIARKCEAMQDVEALIRDADVAMCKAKASGRGQSVSFSQSLGDELRDRRQLQDELVSAVEHREFMLEYQPIVTLENTPMVQGYEALIRWQHPRLGKTYPNKFLDIASETGLIIFIGDWVLREACAASRRLNRGAEPQHRRFMSVNVAAEQFLQPNFLTQLNDTLAVTGADPATIRLEITESVAISAPDKVKALLHDIRKIGVKTSLDDFGTGHSSLSYLQSFPFDSIKLDKSFVDGIEDPKTRNIIKAIFDLASVLEMSVIAEGIESDVQGSLLSAMGCIYGQGFLYGRPTPEAEAFAA